MVSFWPWRRDDSSPASFEKALSSLSAKITATQAQLDKTRSTSRRVKVLWTLYLSFAYLVYAIVLVLVVGWKNLGPWEWSAVAGGPVLIYVTRSALTAFYTFRIDTLSTRLKDQQGERAKTVQRLKDATKYDSTLQLLEKYGGEPKRTKSKKEGGGGGGDGEEAGKPARPGAGSGGPRSPIPGRTGIAPPPTANIPRGDPRMGGSAPGTPQPGRPQQQGGGHQLRREPSAEFAPNAFGPGDMLPPPPPRSPSPLPPHAHPSSIPPHTQYSAAAAAAAGPHWYDRIMDLLLGEDETAAKNRLVLICANCRLVNGQAPPGTKSLSEVGRWRCMACGATNGEMDEGRRIVKEVLASHQQHRGGAGASDSAATTDGDGSSSDIVEVEKEEGLLPEDDGDNRSGLKVRKGRGGGKGKKN